MAELRRGWIRINLGELIDIRNGFAFKSKDYQDNGALLVRQSNLGNKKVSLDKTVFVPKNYINRYVDFVVKKGDILIGMSGSIGKLCVYDLDYPALQNQRTGLAVFFEPETKEYLRYYFETLESQLIVKAKGVAVQNISALQIKSCPVPLPPLPEQHRIVSKLEELFSRLDAGVEALQAIKLQLKRYRQAVLKAAFEGKLTAEWREAHQGQLEPASVLLEKITLERKKSGKYKELPPLNTSDLPELPEVWAWVTIQVVADKNKNAIKAGPFGSSLKKDFYKPKGYKVYGQEQVIRGDASYGNYYIDQEKFDSLESCAVKPGDVLISLVGTIGKVLVLPETIESGIINPRLVKLSLDNHIINNMYFKKYIESLIARQFFSLSSHGGTMDILNLSILKMLPIPLPSLEEQKKISEEIDKHFSIADHIEKVVEQSIKQSDRLRQSILKTAFEGRLVPQDPSDEPAELLLERIKTERAQNQPATSKKTKRTQ